MKNRSNRQDTGKKDSLNRPIYTWVSDQDKTSSTSDNVKNFTSDFMTENDFDDNMVDIILGANGNGTHQRPGAVFLDDVFDIDRLEDHVDEGLVSMRTNDDDSLSIYKYSKAAQVKWEWNDITLFTRGLIVDNKTEEIVGRGFNKFFTYDQLKDLGVDVDLDSPGTIMPKEDGSLGIAYYRDGQWNVSTAGSLTSEQSVHATALMRERYGDTTPVEGHTMCFEIIYPENRIVTDYGDKDELILLGGADQNGHWISPEEFDFEGNKVEVSRGTLRDVLSMDDPGDTTEGHIIVLDSGLMIKHKYDSYLNLHRKATNMTPKKVWQGVKEQGAESFIGDIPDEFQPEVQKVIDDMMERFQDNKNMVAKIASEVPEGTRKDKAIWINQNVDGQWKKMVMTSVLSHGDIDEMIWKKVEPKGNNGRVY